MTGHAAIAADPARAAPPVAFDNSYARLPASLFARVAGAAPPAPRPLALNRPLAALLGIDADWLASPAGVAALAGGAPPPGAEPIAMAYAGHQFGGWSPRLGDGRAMLLGEVVGTDGIRRDLQLKGSGPTPFSRAGDGKAAIGPVLREYLVAEAMAALGVRTTRALAAVATGERIARDGPKPGAVLTRVAETHIRFGTFQFARGSGQDDLAALAAYAIARHFPDAADARELLDRVVGRVAELVAHWQSIGFIHGVMNTDNMSIVGETLDYGPCAFMDRTDPGTVFSSIDHAGRYAYANQPAVAHWNLVRLAEALLPLLDPDPAAAVAAARAALEFFPARYEAARLARFRAKLGFETAHPDDAALIDALLARMEAEGTDFTLGFRGLSAALEAAPDGDAPDGWSGRWRERLRREGRPAAAVARGLDATNPAVIPRNHQVERALAAAEAGDLAPFERLHAALRSPFEAREGDEIYRLPPAPHEIVRATFCGT